MKRASGLQNMMIPLFISVCAEKHILYNISYGLVLLVRMRLEVWDGFFGGLKGM